MNNLYIIPANTKSGRLIFNIFRPIDLAIFLTGLAISLIFFLAIQDSTLIVTIIKILPLAIASFLVVPVPYYHNVLGFIKEVYMFLTQRRIYYWKGWCVKDEYKD